MMLRIQLTPIFVEKGLLMKNVGKTCVSPTVNMEAMSTVSPRAALDYRKFIMSVVTPFPQMIVATSLF